ncbi:MAG: hypothetical protein H6907_03775 [Hyphomicrobiales bacterium]|nr:hypothetical protein [Hyphomicrobiales bacterium]
MTTTTKTLRLAAAGAALLAVAACQTTGDKAAMEADRYAALEAKVHEALRNSAAAKVDAATALDIALENEKKLK